MIKRLLSGLAAGGAATSRRRGGRRSGAGGFGVGRPYRGGRRHSASRSQGAGLGSVVERFMRKR